MKTIGCPSCGEVLDKSNIAGRDTANFCFFECRNCSWKDTIKTCSKCGNYHYSDATKPMCEACVKTKQ